MTRQFSGQSAWRPIARGSPRARRPASAPASAALLLAGALLLGACTGQIGLRQAQDQTCARARLDAAARLFDDARQQTIKHYTTRVNQALHAAYYASADSIAVARSIRRCWDFDRTYKTEAIELIRTNILLQRMVKLNMRDPEPLVATTLLQEQYHEIFDHDIDALNVGPN
ncbi:MAG: hypothetical protein HY342_11220 [Candidatus Lambdaproteobacteria bacterium]|nr:hypothetical protein [Candidatus Lambdaproteobacteria bacterium]